MLCPPFCIRQGKKKAEGAWLSRKCSTKNVHAERFKPNDKLIILHWFFYGMLRLLGAKYKRKELSLTSSKLCLIYKWTEWLTCRGFVYIFLHFCPSFFGLRWCAYGEEQKLQRTERIRRSKENTSNSKGHKQIWPNNRAPIRVELRHSNDSHYVMCKRPIHVERTVGHSERRDFRFF